MRKKIQLNKKDFIMLFKQKPVNGIVFVTCFVTIPFWLFTIYVFIFDFFIGIICAFANIILTLLMLTMVQWFHIYEDHIEVWSIFGKINEVYFANVINIIEKDLNVLRVRLHHYVFDDGRKEKWLFETDYQNHRNTIVRIYITNELKKLIESKNFSIIQYQRY